uniref:Dihydrolipoamide acetyltransferase component of pyruvate dehydrogenase complex n=1 Tax=Candidatus Kentrum sp. UNK TaxID=2126344 RepID=A0A451B4H2_9GAMM|nr:MAG: pyruvate dehydrogenase E2 component (dihydrolipoamide acetyltransferase) [Candidatus Kentron sp. UNK]VFK73156.1 MAG: pyruvate dehydrogenase E2 component (dihydrolipoamide acetyltransferase) [Candidatus Kentron sp. UNK]
MTKATEVKVPDIGDFRDVEVIEIFTALEAEIEPGDPIITLESHKATLEVPSLHAGVVKEIAVAIGDKVSEGDPILRMAPKEGQKSPDSKADSASVPYGGGETARTASTSPPASSPSVRRMARERNVDLHAIEGTGPKGRILCEDVERSAKAAEFEATDTDTVRQAPPRHSSPTVDFSAFGQVDIKPLTRIQRLSSDHLSRAWAEIPHVTQHDLADITDLEAFRQSLRADAETRGARVTLLGFLMKVSVAALKIFPTFNASLAPDGENLIIKQYYHIGIAVDTAEGLVVPVIRDVDKKGIFVLAEELAAITDKARGKRIAPADLQGGCFTISSLGAMGGTGFTPILNAPEVAILGVARSSIQPIYREDEFQPRRMLPLSLSYDHRVIDGVQGAQFMRFLCSRLADIRRLLL